RRHLKVLLLQLDGKLPNIALMRIAAHHRPYADDIAFRHCPTVKGGSVRLVGLRPHLRLPDLRAHPARRRRPAGHGTPPGYRRSAMASWPELSPSLSSISLAKMGRSRSGRMTLSRSESRVRPR